MQVTEFFFKSRSMVAALQLQVDRWRQHDVSEETAAIRGDADSDRLNKLTRYTRVILLSF